METPPNPTDKFFPYLLLGFSFVVLGLVIKGMIAFVGVGAAFLYVHYKQTKKEKNQ